MSPFKSKSQMKAAFGGHLGPEMKKKAKTWAEETPNMKKLPEHKKQVRSLQKMIKARHPGMK